ncbi:hypothetical protein GC163_14940 [bacterium]|nr:hypothetical protein [bacterium]
MASVISPPTSSSVVFDYLVLGDLRELLDQSNDTCHCRWLIAVLDRLLTDRPTLDQVVLLTGGRSEQADSDFYAKLQRLRDRVAHRKPYLILANEIRCDLQALFGPSLRS